MNDTDAGREIWAAIGEIRKDQDLLISSLASLAESIKTALLGTLNRETSMRQELGQVKQNLADMEARLEKLEKLQ